MTPISLIITVKNEQASIISLLDSIVAQSRLPDEVIIVDGNSSDNTFAVLNKYIEEIHELQLCTWRVFSKASNISAGRNIAIGEAKHQLLAITDAGCVLEEDWLAQLENCYQKITQEKQTKDRVVAGYYKGLPSTPFEEAVVPYALVMPDQVHPESFLPATRSMLLPKKIWKEVGGFDENLTVSEDFAFAHQVLKKYGEESIVFCQDAVVGWRPRSTFKQFAKMIFKMAEGDIRAGIYRGKVKLLFGRYTGGLLVLLAVIKSGNNQGFIFLFVGFLVYLAWSIRKNKHYTPNGWQYLPALQLIADVSVMAGSLRGLFFKSS